MAYYREDVASSKLDEGRCFARVVERFSSYVFGFTYEDSRPKLSISLLAPVSSYLFTLRTGSYGVARSNELDDDKRGRI